ncbi:uncharacterized protein LOC125674294 [Ostrea edulis]|uniref:uncharacterized protein LOC125674294 n=1 Tax=Ostrea edulis TaxID=37623 RepID=UPI0024AF15BB|nr:uncharacterized protein LOC125674294 [Ostrea edulis]
MIRIFLLSCVCVSQVRLYNNIALGKLAQQLYPYSSFRWGADKAVDGLKSDYSAAGGQCTISGIAKRTARWWVDLGGVLSIHHITIYYRTDNVAWDFDNAYTTRFLGFSVYISNTTNKDDGVLCFKDTVYTRATIPNPTNITCLNHGRYVIYYIERLQGVTYPPEYSSSAHNELCEFEVYGCPTPGVYGENCDIPCPQNCQERHCDIVTGTCLGCIPGYKGSFCDQLCDNKKYGLECKQNCGNCSDGIQCNHVNGSCPNGCDVGARGDKCDEDLDSDCVEKLVENIQVSFHNVSWTTAVAGPITQYDPQVNLICSFTPAADDTLLYHITWNVDNNILIKSQNVDKTSLQNAILSADDLHNAGKKIGIWIQCIVGLTKSEDKLPCVTKGSTLFFAGIEVLNETLTIERQDHSTIMVRPTIPFGSQTLDTGTQNTSPLNIQLSFLNDNIKAKCRANGGFAQCSITIPSYTYDERQKYDDTTNWYKIYTMTVYNSDEEGYYIDNRRLVLRLETNSPAGNGARIFGGVVLPDVYINIVESNEAWKGKRCSSYIDPHLTSFDGLPFECQATGCITGKTYTFYKNSDHLQEVQVRHANCWGSPRCACAVAARSGQDVFTMDFCDSRRYINFPICKDKSLKVIKETDKLFKILFPTGTYVKVMLYDSGSWYMNIEVYPTVADVQKTSGLCGFLDDDTTNDLRLLDGSISTSSPPDDFSLSWKLPDGSADDLLSHSHSVYDTLAPLSTYFQKLCTCDRGKTYCSYKKYVDCETDVKGKEYQCILHNSARKKRDLEFIHNVQKREQQSETKMQRVVRSKRQVITVADAQKTCYTTFEESQLYATCLEVVPNFSNESVENCILDLSMTGEENLTQIHLETALGQCQAYILLNSTLKKEQSNFSEIMINLCPNNCSSNGICSGGNCTCNYGYGGSDCSFDILSPPTITKISDDGLCDKTEEACDDITLYGQYFLENMGTTCYVNRQEITETKNISSQESYTVSLEERTLYEGYCRLDYSLTNTWSTTFEFKISNDGTQFSEMYYVCVYQSECQIFNNDTGSVYFTLQDGYCYINGSCIQKGEFSGNDSYYRCDPDTNRYDWTYECNTTVSTTQDTGTTASSTTNTSTSSIGTETTLSISSSTSAPGTTSTGAQTTLSISSSVASSVSPSDTTSTSPSTTTQSTPLTSTSQSTSQSTTSLPLVSSSTDSVHLKTTSPSLNDIDDNSHRSTKQDTELSERAIGLICAVAFITVAIISLTGYLLKAKCSKR